MTFRQAPSPAPASAALDNCAAPMVDGQGSAWLQWGALPFPRPGRYECRQLASAAAGRVERQ